MREIYLDWAATALQDQEIMESSLREALSYQGNPSSRHLAGNKAKERLHEIRQECGEHLNVPSDQLYFTSGGTESNNLILLSQSLNRTQGRVIISSIEHPSIGEPAGILKKEGADLKILRPNEKGIITGKTLLKHLSRETRMVSVMAVNNETGAIQPIEELVRVVREYQGREGSRPIHFHCDMVQAPGKIPIDLSQLDLDSASFSAHKMGGPKGVGLLYLRKPMAVLYRGGGQERGIRPGTESIQSAKAMAQSLKKHGSLAEGEQLLMTDVSDFLLESLSHLKGIVFNPPSRLTEPHLYVKQIVNFSLPPLPGEVLQRILSERGLCISTGSACSSNKKSHTQGLLSMGISEKLAHCSVRVSLGPTTEKDDIDSLLNELKEIIHDHIQH